jgi:hypothetical protein
MLWGESVEVEIKLLPRGFGFWNFLRLGFFRTLLVVSLVTGTDGLTAKWNRELLAYNCGTCVSLTSLRFTTSQQPHFTPFQPEGQHT